MTKNLHEFVSVYTNPGCKKCNGKGVIEYQPSLVGGGFGETRYRYCDKSMCFIHNYQKEVKFLRKTGNG